MKALLDREAAADKASENIIQVVTTDQPPADLLVSITPGVRTLVDSAANPAIDRDLLQWNYGDYEDMPRERDSPESGANSHVYRAAADLSRRARTSLVRAPAPAAGPLARCSLSAADP